MENDTDGYRRQGDKLRFAGMEVWDVVYLFRNGEFAGVGIEVPVDKVQDLVDAATRAFGPQVPAFVRETGAPAWLSERSFAIVERPAGAKRARLLIGSRGRWGTKR